MLDKFIHRVFRLGTALITFLFFVTTFSLAMHAQPSKPPRRDIILLLDGSRSAAFRYDKANKRGHFAKFLIRFFQSFGPETNAIGVTWFAREMSHTIPLMPAREWSKADLFNVAPPWCPRPENPIARTAEDPCYKTDYVSALRWGSEQLKECNLGNKECYIVVFTDGKLGELGDGDSPEEVRNYLEILRNRNVHIYSVLFRKAISLTVEENRVWNKWTDGVLYGAETRAAEDLYGEILGFLGMDKEFKILRKVNVNGRSKIFIKGLPPNLQDLRLDVLPDREDIRDTYSITPNISIGVTRWWYDIQADEITAEFHGQGLVFYRIVSRTLPVDISVDVWPSRPVVGEPLEIRTFIRAGSRYLGPAALERVWAQLMPGLQSVDLKYQGDGVWSGQLPQAPKGKHEIIVRLEPRGNWPIEPTNIITFSLMPQGCTPKVVWDVYPKEITAGANVRCEANFYRCGKIVAPPDVISASIDFPFGNKKCVLHWDPTYLGWSGTTIITGEGKITATLIAKGGLWSDGVYRSSGKFIDIRRPMTLSKPATPVGIMSRLIVLLTALIVVFIVAAFEFGKRISKWSKQRKIIKVMGRIVNSNNNNENTVDDLIRLLEEWRDYFKFKEIKHSVSLRKIYEEICEEIINKNVGNVLGGEIDSNNPVSWVGAFLEKAATGNEIAIYIMIQSIVYCYYQKLTSFKDIISSKYLKTVLAHHPAGVKKALQEIEGKHRDLPIFFFIKEISEIFYYWLDFDKMLIGDAEKYSKEYLKSKIHVIVKRTGEIREGMDRKWEKWARSNIKGKDHQNELIEQINNFANCVGIVLQNEDGNDSQCQEFDILWEIKEILRRLDEINRRLDSASTLALLKKLNSRR